MSNIEKKKGEKEEKIPIFFKKTSKFKKLKKYSDKFLQNKLIINNSNDLESSLKRLHLSNDEISKPKNSISNQEFHGFLKKYFEYDPLKQKFFSKKRNRDMPDLYPVDPQETYKNSVKISQNLIKSNANFQEISFHDYFKSKKIHPSSEFFKTMDDLSFLIAYKRIINTENTLDDKDFLFENNIKFITKYKLNLIEQNLINIKTLYLESLNILFFLILAINLNESRIIVWIQALELDTFRISEGVLIKGPTLSNLPEFADAFLVSLESDKHNISLFVIMKDSLTKFDLIIKKNPLTEEIILTKPVLSFIFQMPQINKCCLISSEYLVLRHVSLKKIYKFSLKQKNFLKKDLEPYSVTLFDVDAENNLIICYTESQKIMILNEKLDIIFNELFMKIESWKIFQSQKNQIELLILRTGVNKQEKFVFTVFFEFNENLKIWKADYKQLKYQNDRYSFPSKINLNSYDNNSINILFLKQTISVIYDDNENSERDFDYYSTDERIILFKRKDFINSSNQIDNQFFLSSLKEKNHLISLFEVQKNIIRIFILK